MYTSVCNIYGQGLYSGRSPKHFFAMPIRVFFSYGSCGLFCWSLTSNTTPVLVRAFITFWLL